MLQLDGVEVARCQDFPAGGWLEAEGGDAEDLSPSFWSVSSTEADAAELLRDTRRQVFHPFL